MNADAVLTLIHEDYPVCVSEAELLRDFSGEAYRAVGADRTFLLKLIKHGGAETALRSVSVIRRLTERGFHAPKIILTREGGLCAQRGDFTAILMEYIDGREPEPGEVPELAGELLGQLHVLASDFNDLPECGYDFFVGRYLRILGLKHYPPDRLYRFADYGDSLWERVKALPRGVCHGDAHRGNMLLTPSGGLYLLDFDEVCVAPLMFDAAVYCDVSDYFTLAPGAAERNLCEFERFRTGYKRYRPLESEERRALPDFAALRHFQLQATIIERLGLDCVDNAFVDRQLAWLDGWQIQCKELGL